MKKYIALLAAIMPSFASCGTCNTSKIVTTKTTYAQPVIMMQPTVQVCEPVCAPVYEPVCGTCGPVCGCGY